MKCCGDFFVGRKCVYSLGCKNKEHQCCLDEISWLQCAPTLCMLMLDVDLA